MDSHLDTQNLPQATMLSARKAAKILHCAPDYIGKLCREGKLVGELRDNVWHVDPVSVAEYQKSRKEAKAQRSQELAAERRAQMREAQRATKGVAGRFWMQAREHRTVALASIAAGVALFVASGALTFAMTGYFAPSSQTAALAHVESPFFNSAVPSVGLGDLLSGVSNFFASLFAPKASAPQVAEQQNFPAPAPTQPIVATSTPSHPTTIVTNTYPVIERTVEHTVTNTVSGITQDYLNQQLNAIRSEIASMSSGSSGVVLPYAPATRIDQLTNVAISGGSITNASISGGSLSGVSLSTGDLSGVVAAAHGGTGTSSTPVYGQLLLGNAAGGYDLVSTSSLGIGASANAGGASGQVQYNSGGALGGSSAFTFDASSGTVSIASLIATNATTTNATTTNFSATNASTTNLTVSSLGSSAGQCLTTNSSGTLTTTTCGSGGSSFAYLFPNNATTTQIAFNGGATFAGATTTALAVTGSTTINTLNLTNALGVAFGGTGSTTLGGLLTGNGTGALTSATVSAPLSFSGNTLSIQQATASQNGYLATTDWNSFNSRLSTSTLGLFDKGYFFSTTSAAYWGSQQGYDTFAYLFPNNATTTALGFNGGITASNILATGSTTLQSFTGVNATTTNATTTTFAITNISSSLLKTLGNGAVVAAQAGVDYQAAGNYATFGYLFPSNATTTQIAFNGGLTAVGATTTNFSTTNASTTNLVLSSAGGAGTRCLQVDAQGNVSANASACGTGSSSFGYLFPNNATTTQLAFNGGLTAYASSTIGNGTQTGGLTINGGATTTGAAYFAGSLHINGTLTTNVASCTGSQALQTSATGDVICGTLATGGASSAGGWTTDGIGSVTLSTTTDRVAIGATSTPYAKLSVVSGAAGTTTLALVPASGQTANIIDIYNTSGALSSVLSASGNFGLGTTSPFAKLSVSGDGYFAGALTASTISATTSAVFASTTLSGNTLLTNATSTNLYASNFTVGTLNSGSTGTTTIVGNLIPSADNTYSLGAANLTWKHVFIGPGSLYVNGQEVLHTDGSNNVVLSSSPNQNLIVQTSGTANIELNPTGGTINLKNTVNVSAGKSITTSDLSALPIPNGVAAGNITINGNAVTAANLNGGIALTPNGSGNTYVTVGNFGIGTTNPSQKLDVQGEAAAQFFTATSSTNASTFPLLTATTATTTNLALTSVTGSLLKTNALGQLVAAIAGTDYLTSGSIFGYPFPNNATSTSIAFNGGLTATGASLSSTTLSGSSLFGNATTTSFAISNITAGSVLKTATGGAIVAAVPGTDFENPLSFSYPLTRSVNAISLAFGTTTNNTWSGSNSFTGAVTLGNATSSNFAISSIASSLLKTTASGAVVPAVAGVDYLTSGSIFGYPFPNNATSTSIAFNGGLTATGASLSSTTLTGNFVFGNATGTNATTTSLFSSVARFALASTTNLVLSSASSCSSTQALTTDASGNVVCGTISTGVSLSAANTWTALQTFAAGASTTQLSVFNRAYFGATGTTTIDSTGAITVTSNSQNTFPFASSTALTVSNALYTPVSSALLKTDSSGKLVAAVAGTDYDTFAWPFTSTLNYGTTTNSTSTPMWFTAGIEASSTSHFATADFSGPITSTATGASTFPYASTTALTVSGNFYGASLSTCNTSADKLLWANGTFSCGTDQSGSGGSDINWTYFNGSGVRVSTSTNQILLGDTATSTLARLEVHGGANFDSATTTSLLVTGTGQFTGSVGIGTTSPQAQLAIGGGDIVQVASGAPTLASTVATSSTTHSFASVIAGHYLYSADYEAGLRIIDISNPQAPTTVGSYTTSLTHARAVAVAGKYAYVGDDTSGLTILDVSRPNAPQLVGTYSGIDANNLALSGRYVYVATNLGGTFDVIDVSDPTNPRLADAYTLGAGDLGTSQPYTVAVQGKYAYVGDYGKSRIYIVDISNPAQPSSMGSYLGNSPTDLYVSGKYLYVADNGGGLYILNVGNPASPSLVSTYNNGAQYYGVRVAGSYAYVADHAGNLTVVDVHDPVHPALVGSLAVGDTPNGVSVSGKYAYVAANGLSEKVVDLNGAQFPTASIGALDSNTANISDSLTVGGDISAGGGLDVGIGGIFSRGTIAAYVASSTQINPTVATFIGGNVGVGTTSPFASLSVQANNLAANGTEFIVGSSTQIGLIVQGGVGSNDVNAAFGGMPAGPSTGYSQVTINGTTGAALNLRSALGSFGIQEQGDTYLSAGVGNGMIFNVNNATEVARFTSAGNVGIGTTTPWAKLSLAAKNGDTTTTLFAIGSSTASATTTLFSVSNTGSTTLAGIANSLLKVNAGGTIVAAVPGTDYATPSSVAGYPFPLTGNATSTLTQFNGGLTAYASSTIGNGTQTGGLTISGGATTTGNAYFAGTVGIGRSNPGSGTTGQGGTSFASNLLEVYSTGRSVLSIRSDNTNNLATLVLSANNAAQKDVHINVDSNGALRINQYSTGSTENLTLDSTGNLGIGTTTPYAKLSVAGNLVATNLTATGTLAVSGLSSLNGGLTAFASSTIGNGTQTGGLTISGGATTTGNAYFGGQLTLTDPGVSTSTLIALGGRSLFNVSTSSDNLFIGLDSGSNIATGGDFNTGFGYQSLAAIKTSQNDDAFGAQALANTTGSFDAGFGRHALFQNTTGGENVAVGGFASQSNSAATNTVAIGAFAASGGALYHAQGYTIVGENAGGNILTGADYGTFLGFQSGATVSSGYANILIGAEDSSSPFTAGNLSTGSGNVALGNDTFFPSATANNQLNIGGILFGSLPATSTAFKLPTSGAIGVGTSSPFAKFGIQANNGDTATTLFAIGSSTASATTTLFSVTNAGNVGIGTANPSSLLSVNSTATSTLDLSTGAQDLVFSGSALNNSINSLRSNDLLFQSNSITKAVLQAGTGNFGLGTTSPFATLSVSGNAFITGGATSTSLAITGVTSSLLKTLSNGAVVAAVAGTDYATPSSVAGYPFPLTGNATSTLTQFNGGLTAYASSTIGNGTQTGGLTISGGATTTGNFDVVAGSAYQYNGANVITASTTLNDYFFGVAGNSTMTGTGNTGVGYWALLSNTSGVQNTATGYSAFVFNTTGGDNTAYGAASLMNNTTGSYNAANGSYALFHNTTGSYNTANGSSALDSLTTGSYNVANGAYALFRNVTGDGNTANGVDALTDTTGSYNTGNGDEALLNTTTGYFNVAEGYLAGNKNTVGTSTTLLGSFADASLNNLSTSTALGAGALVGENNAIALGGLGQNSVYAGIGTTSPFARLSIQANPTDSIANTTLFAIGSSTASATTTLFSVSNTGVLALNPAAQTGDLVATLGGTSFLTASTTAGNTGLGLNVLSNITSGAHNSAFGQGALLFNDAGSYNTALGAIALTHNYSGIENTGSGFGAIAANLTGSYNSGFGAYSLYNATSTSNNTAVGDDALAGSNSGPQITGTQNVAVGNSALQNFITGSQNSALGYQSLLNATSTQQNTALGFQALKGDTANFSGGENVAIGYQTLQSNTTGFESVAIGNSALTNNTSGGGTAVGYNALYSNTTGTGNVALGWKTLFSNTTGANNIAIGTQALSSNSNGGDNIGIGLRSLFVNTNGSSNTAVGNWSLSNSTTTSDNTALGYAALSGLNVGPAITGAQNVAVGESALTNFITASQNAAIGFQALLNATSTQQNTALGFQALKGDATNFSGGENVAVGYQTLLKNTTGVQSVAVGNSALANNTSGGGTAIGYNTLFANTTGQDNVAVGWKTLMLNTTGSVNTAVGDQALDSNTNGSNNEAFGMRALAQNISGNNNVGIGNGAIQYATTTSDNTALGHAALQGSTVGALTITGTQNVALGESALQNFITASNNVALGYQALQFSTSSVSNIAIGQAALQGPSISNGSTGANNVAIGQNALNGNTTGASNIGIGYFTLSSNSSGIDNIGIGQTALESNTSGNRNVAIGGLQTMLYNQTGGSNISIGYSALRADVSGSGNVALGDSAGYLTTGQNNTLLGSAAGLDLLSGSSNIIIGANVDAPASTTNAQLNIGNLLYGTNIYSNLYAQSSAPVLNGSIGISTSSPFAKFGIQANNGDTNTTLFAIGSSTASATTTLFSINNTGVLALNPASQVGDLVATLGGTSFLTASSTGKNVALGLSALSGITNGGGNAAFGDHALAVDTTGSSNTAVGQNALASNVSGNHNAAFGNGTLLWNTADFNTAIGDSALAFSISGTQNTAVGRAALQNNNTGSNNVSIGMNSMFNATSTNDNVAVGNGALQGSTAGSLTISGTQNVAVGESALQNFITGSENTAVGYAALQNATSSSNNAALGWKALQSLTTGSDNVALGREALLWATSSVQNIAIGSQALSGGYDCCTPVTAASGNYNVAIGQQTLFANQTGTANVAIGMDQYAGNVLSHNTTGSYNVGIGAGALTGNTTGSDNFGVLSLGGNGSDNIGILSGALQQNTTGSSNVAIGKWALTDSTSGGNNVAVGNTALANNISATNTVAVGVGAGSGPYASNMHNQGGVFVGYSAGSSVVTGADYNTFVGYHAGINVTSGANNVLLGADTSCCSNYSNLTTGSNNIGIGNNIWFASSTLNNQLDVQDILFGTNNAAGALAPSTGQLGVGTTSPFARFGIQANNGDTNTTLFAIGSSTASATTTLFSVDNQGNTNLAGALTVTGTGSSTFTGPIVAATNKDLMLVQPDGNYRTYINPYMSGANHVQLAISTSTPSANLGSFAYSTIVGGGLYADGIGIGTTLNPVNNGLVVQSTGCGCTSTSSAAYFYGSTGSTGLSLAAIDSYDNATDVGALRITGNRGTIQSLYVASNGLVGLGTTTPSQKLSVQGNGLFSGDLSLANINATGTLNFNDTGANRTLVNYGGSAFITASSTANNISLGLGALASVTSGNSLVAIGAGALASNATGADNVAIGTGALQYNDGTARSVAIGTGALQFGGGGAGANVAVGFENLRSIGTGGYNTAVGYTAGYGVSSGLYNIVLGSFPNIGDNISTGNNNIVIGHDISVATSTYSNSLNVQNILFGTNNSGSGIAPSTGQIGVGTSTPWARLSIAANNGDTNTTLFAIGSSTANSTTTLFAVDNTGSTTIRGNLTVQGAGTSTFAGNIAVGPTAFANNTSLAGGVGSTALLEYVKAIGSGSFAWGDTFMSGSAGILASGAGSMAVGVGQLTASNSGSIALGYGDAHFGGVITSSGQGSFAAGDSGTGNITASGQGSFAFGDNVGATANYATAFGTGFTNSTASSFAVGYGASPTLTVSASGATTTKFAITGVTSSLLKTLSNGAVVAAVAGTDYATPSSVASAFPFTVSAFGSTAANATSTLIKFNAGIASLASSTIGNGNQNGGLTIFGGATTTGNAYFASKVGIGTTSPGSLFSISGTNQTGNFVNIDGGTGPSTVGAAGGSILFKAGSAQSLNGLDGGGITLVGGNGSGLNGGNGGSVSITGGNGTLFSNSGTVTINPGSGLNPFVLLATANSGIVGVGTSSPFAKLSVAANNGDTNTTLFAIGSSTANSTTTLFSINNKGVLALNPATQAGDLVATLSGTSFLTASSTAFNTGVGLGALSSITSGGGIDNTAVGYNALLNATSTQKNTALGAGALQGNALDFSGTWNTAVGYSALANDTEGSDNVSVGFASMANNTTGSQNAAVGEFALNANTTGGQNNAFGEAALANNTGGHYNSAFGNLAQEFNLTGWRNAAFGAGALQNATSTDDNTALGYGALQGSTAGSLTITGTKNVAVGPDALQNFITATQNTAIGYQALLNATSTNNNTAVGFGALTGNASRFLGANNTALGATALNSIVLGDNNVGIGYGAGASITNGANNIFVGTDDSSLNNVTTGARNISIGYDLSLPSATASGQLNLQNILFGTNNVATGGNTSTGQLGVGTTSPFARFGIQANNGDTNTTLFAIGSSTANSTTTLFSINNIGNASLTGTQIPSSGAPTGMFNVTGSQSVADNTTGHFSYGGAFTSTYWGGGSTYGTAGLYASALNSGSGSVASLIGVDSNPQNSSSAATTTSLIGVRTTPLNALGTTTNMFGFYGYESAFAGSVTNMIGSYSGCSQSGTAVVSNCYGEYLDAPSGTFGSTYGVYQLGANTPNYFAGNIGIGTSTPWAQLSVNPYGITGPAFAIGSSSQTSFVVGNGGNVGIGTTSPWGLFSLVAQNGQNNANILTIASSTAATTTTFATLSNNGFLSVGASTVGTPTGVFTVDSQSGTTTIANLSLGNLTFDTDAGIVNLSDIPVDSSVAAGVQQAQVLNIGGNPLLTLSGIANGSGGVNNLGVAIGTSTTPYAMLHVVGSDASALTTAFLVSNNSSSTLLKVQDNGNVGVGTTSPFAKFSIAANTGDTNTTLFAIASSTASATTTLFSLDNSGLAYFSNSVGIGTTTQGIANAGLVVQTSGLGEAGIIIANNAPLFSTYTQMEYQGTGRSWYSGVGNATETTFGVANDYFVYDSNASAMRFVIDTNGDTGIGSTSPTAKLAVDTSSLAAGVAEFAVGSSSRSDFLINQNGNVGIGTTSPGIESFGSLPDQVPTLTVAGTGYFDSGLTLGNHGSVDPGVSLWINSSRQPIMINGSAFYDVANGTLNVPQFINRSGAAVQFGDTATPTNVTVTGALTSGAFAANGTIDFNTVSNNPYQSKSLENYTLESLGSSWDYPYYLHGIIPISNGLTLANAGCAEDLTGTNCPTITGLNIDMSSATSSQGQYFPATFMGGNVGIGTLNPYGTKLSIWGKANDGFIDTNLFKIASTTNTGTSTLFVVKNTGSVGIGSSSPNALLTVDANSLGSSATTPLLRLQGRSSQAADYFDIYDSAGNNIFSVDQNGTLATTHSIQGVIASFQSNNGASAPLSITGVFGGGQTADLFDIYNANSGPLTDVFNNKGYLGIGTSTPSGMLALSANAGSTFPGNNLLVIASSTSNSTTTLFSVSNTGVVSFSKSSFNSTGALSLADQSSSPGTSSLITLGGRAFITESVFQYNTTLGLDSLARNVLGSNNTAVGYQALQSATSSSQNSAFGYQALNADTSGGSNSAFGNQSLLNNSTGSDNAGFGISSLYSNTSGGFNVALGPSSLYNNQTGSSNVGMGFQALYANTAGSFNTAVGEEALGASQITGSTGLGYDAGWGCQTNDFGSNYIGFQTGYDLNCTTAGNQNFNTYLGYQAGYNVDSGYANILIGASSTNALTTGSNDIAIGNFTNFQSTNTSNALNIGGILFGSLPATSTAFKLPTSGAIGVGTSSPFGKFSIAANNGDTNTTLFAIGSSTSNSTTTLFSVSNTGATTISGTANLADGANIYGSFPAALLASQENTSSTGYNATGYYDNASTYVGAIGYANSGASLFASSFFVGTQGKNFVLSNSANVNNNNFVMNGSTGNIGIGTTTPDTLLAVGSATPTGSVAHFENSTGSCYINPTTTSLSCTSDARLKKNVVTLGAPSGIAAIDALNPVLFNWNSEATGTPEHAGFIAQQAMQVFPDLVQLNPDGYYSLNYAGLTPYLTKAIQEQQSEITSIASSSATFAQMTIQDGSITLGTGATSTVTLNAGQLTLGAASTSAITISAGTINMANAATTTIAVGNGVWTIATSTATGTMPIISVSAPASSTPTVSINGTFVLNGQDVSSIASTSATTTPAALVQGPFASATSALQGAITTAYNAIQNIAQTGVRQLGAAVYASVGSFNQLFTEKLVATDITADTVTANQKLCIGKTCVTETQLQNLLNGQAASGSTSTGTTGTTTTTTSTTSTSTSTPPTISINGNNPATVTVGTTYSDLGATATDVQGHSLTVHTFVNGAAMDPVVIDTSAVGSDTIDYVATDTWGNTATSTRTVNIVSATPTTTTTTTSTSTSATSTTP